MATQSLRSLSCAQKEDATHKPWEDQSPSLATGRGGVISHPTMLMLSPRELLTAKAPANQLLLGFIWLPDRESMPSSPVGPGREQDKSPPLFPQGWHAPLMQVPVDRWRPQKQQWIVLSYLPAFLSTNPRLTTLLCCHFIMFMKDPKLPPPQKKFDKPLYS